MCMKEWCGTNGSLVFSRSSFSYSRVSVWGREEGVHGICLDSVGWVYCIWVPQHEDCSSCLDWFVGIGQVIHCQRKNLHVYEDCKFLQGFWECVCSMIILGSPGVSRRIVV